MLFDVCVAAVAIGIHRDDGGEVFDFELPNGFWGAELVVVIDVWDIDDGGGENLCGTAHGMQIDATEFFAGFSGFRTHAAFSDDGFQTIAFDERSLVGLFTGGCCGACRRYTPFAVGIFDDDGAAMVDDGVCQVGGWWLGHGMGDEILVGGVTRGENRACDFDGVAEFQRTDILFCEWKVEFHRLFDVHDLFADAIQFGLEAEGIACDIHVRRLGGKGVGFAIHLLAEEIQITARIIVAVQKLRILNEM